MRKGNFYQSSIPTCEDVLDVNLRAIVSDCRGLISGTLVPRSWADISETWFDDDSASRNRPIHRSKQTRTKMSVSAKEVWSKRVRPTSRRMKELHRIMVRTLQSNGMAFKDAHDKARELLGIK